MINFFIYAFWFTCVWFFLHLFLFIYKVVSLSDLSKTLVLSLTVFGILFIFLWILVDQMFIRAKHGLDKPLVPRPAARWDSLSSVKSASRGHYLEGGGGTVKSVKSLASVHSAKSQRWVKILLEKSFYLFSLKIYQFLSIFFFIYSGIKSTLWAAL